MNIWLRPAAARQADEILALPRVFLGPLHWFELPVLLWSFFIYLFFGGQKVKIEKKEPLKFLSYSADLLHFSPQFTHLFTSSQTPLINFWKLKKIHTSYKKTPQNNKLHSYLL